MDYLHDADCSSPAPRKVLDRRDHVGGIEERLGMRRQKHVEAHQRRRRPSDVAGHGEPHEKVPHEALRRAGEVHDPRPLVHGRRRDEEAGDHADVSADVLKEGDRVEGGLIVALRRLQHRRVDSEAVGSSGGTLDPRARCHRHPFAPPHGGGGGDRHGAVACAAPSLCISYDVLLRYVATLRLLILADDVAELTHSPDGFRARRACNLSAVQGIVVVMQPIGH